MEPLTLYTTAGCHLCEQAVEVIRGALDAPRALRQVEIADEPELLARYGVRIPVLAVAGRTEELGWPFDVAAVRAFLSRM